MLADPAGADDGALVEAVRRGDDRAFEELYARYLAPITGFVAGRVHDHARAEDIAQDVFVSALRRIRATESAIAFRPWIYEIARNACIDAYRRGRRAEQVPLESERLAPADRDRLVAGGPAPEAAVAVKEELDHLRGAFGSLSDVHHEILVLRELEGLSYEAIGERLGMTKAGVESTLFRARRRLGEEYEGLESGERCASVQGIVADAAHRRLGVRERRRVTSHAAHCDPCRRLAIGAGFEIDVPRRRRIARRLGAWLPIPAILRRGGEQAATVVGRPRRLAGPAARLPRARLGQGGRRRRGARDRRSRRRRHHLARGAARAARGRTRGRRRAGAGRRRGARRPARRRRAPRAELRTAPAAPGASTSPPSAASVPPRPVPTRPRAPAAAPTGRRRRTTAPPRATTAAAVGRRHAAGPRGGRPDAPHGQDGSTARARPSATRSTGRATLSRTRSNRPPRPSTTSARRSARPARTSGRRSSTRVRTRRRP